MFERKKIQMLDDFFKECNSRNEKGVYFYRVNGYNSCIDKFIQEYYERARVSGVIIEGRIPNPDEKNLAYYYEIMGMDFMMSVGFISKSLKKWLPRMNEYQRENVTLALYDTLDGLRKKGKNENMLKNAYIKFMCWLYYRFERIIKELGENTVPKILYEGSISMYELLLLSVLSKAGCDVVLLQYKGDQEYAKIDPESAYSEELCISELVSFPAEFNLRMLRERKKKELETERLYGQKPAIRNCTNAWLHGDGIEDMKTADFYQRGSDPGLFYNYFCRINGVEDKITYLNELYQFWLELKNRKRKTVIVEQGIPKPSMEEIQAIHRRNYEHRNQMLMELSNNIRYSANIELQRIMNQAFIDVMLEESEKEGMNQNKLMNRAVFLLCWLNRYQKELFGSWKAPEIACFIYLGGCHDQSEALFLRFLARLPVDVLVLRPNQNDTCILEDSILHEVHYAESMVVSRFPSENTDVHIGTAAYHAERELDTIMYQDSGMYRNRQYERAVVVNLQTMYEEIPILWNQELKYRPSFSIVEDVVNIPVICAKVCGVKDRNINAYWADIKQLITEDTILIKDIPFINSLDANPIKAHVAGFIKNGRLKVQAIKEHSAYQYGVLREETQNYILEKLQQLIERKIIRGTFENGTEYTVIATVLNMKKELVRLIQKFDFTKKNPKIVCINTTETVLSLEDSILMAFLNMIGFDIVFFVPTGYQTVEKYFNSKFMEEHQIGDYVYDLQVPDFGKIPSNHMRQSWREKIFKRGN